MISFKMSLFLFSLHLIKYSQRNVKCLTMIIIFSFPLYFFWFLLYIYIFVRCLMVYDVSLLCELYLLSLKIFFFVPFNFCVSWVFSHVNKCLPRSLFCLHFSGTSQTILLVSSFWFHLKCLLSTTFRLFFAQFESLRLLMGGSNLFTYRVIV